MCTGLLKPSSGSVKNVYDIVKNPLEAKKNFGYVPDSPYLYNNLSGREFLDLVANIYMGKQSDESSTRIEELLKKMQLTKDTDKLIGTYSHGMRRKIALCAAFLHNPSVVFLDEPTIGLDASSAKAAKDLFRKHADEGAAILFTTHVLEVAERLCDRIGIIYEG